MDTKFLAHNTHWENPKEFAKYDPQLRNLAHQKYIYHSPVLDALPRDQPGIYTLSGGRQIGKTTLLKQWMEHLLKRGTRPQAIAFFSGELIADYQALSHLLQAELETMPADSLRYILLDEVSYIKEWDRTIKYLADAGLLESVVLVITGSDVLFIREARMYFPGRRGKANQVDFHLYPLSFKEFIHLVNGWKHTEWKHINENAAHLLKALQQYLIHGGYLTAINDFAANQTITSATLHTYSDWIRGDMLKRGKQEHYLREIIQAIAKRYRSQITWNSLAKDLSIDHPKTVADYVELLSAMDVVFIQPAILEDKLTAAPKKARKLMFTDPFIFHALRTWLISPQDPYAMIQETISDPIWNSHLIEALAANYYHRLFPTYYIKAEGEVDIAYVKDKHFWPVEIKWTNQLRPKDLQQIAKYPNGLILTKTIPEGVINGIKTIPLLAKLLE